jgi:hypothetical protein
MRKALVARFILTMTAVSAAGIWIACGGSDSHVTPNDAGKDSGGGGDKDSGSGEIDSGPKDSGPKDSGGGGPVYDAGEPNVLDAGDGGIACVVGGELEEEPNDTELTANMINFPDAAMPVHGTRCGIVRVDALDAGENDFLKFQLADASTRFYVQYAGNVHVVVETDGSAPIDVTEPDASVAFKKGQPYYVQVTSKDGKQQVWRVSVFQQ